VKDHIVIKTVSRILIPFIQLFALYVIAHGDISPGGGFQGGVILGSSIILYVIAFGIEDGRGRMKEAFNDSMHSVGVLIYAVIGLLCIAAGGAYLEYSALAMTEGGHSEHAGHAIHTANHLGIYGIEIGVGIAVAGVMMTIFFETARHDGDD